MPSSWRGVLSWNRQMLCRKSVLPTYTKVKTLSSIRHIQINNACFFDQNVLETSTDWSTNGDGFPAGRRRFSRRLSSIQVKSTIGRTRLLPPACTMAISRWNTTRFVRNAQCTILAFNRQLYAESRTNLCSRSTQCHVGDREHQCHDDVNTKKNFIRESLRLLHGHKKRTSSTWLSHTSLAANRSTRPGWAEERREKRRHACQYVESRRLGSVWTMRLALLCLPTRVPRPWSSSCYQSCIRSDSSVRQCEKCLNAMSRSHGCSESTLRRWAKHPTVSSDTSSFWTMNVQKNKSQGFSEWCCHNVCKLILWYRVSPTKNRILRKSVPSSNDDEIPSN